MNPPSYQQQARDLIDGLKAVCASNGLGNDGSDGNEYKIIVQTFLYKLLCDKFAHEMKRLDPKLADAHARTRDRAHEHRGHHAAHARRERMSEARTPPLPASRSSPATRGATARTIPDSN